MSVVPVVHNVLQINTCTERERNVVKYICSGCIETSVLNLMLNHHYY